MNLLTTNVKKVIAVATSLATIAAANTETMAAAKLSSVNVYVNGTLEETIKTEEKSTKDFIEYYRNETGEDYFLKREDYKANIEDNMDLYLISEEDEIQIENVEIPFETVRIETDELEIGTEVVKTQGVTGMKKVTTTTHLVGGVPSGEPSVDEQVIIEPLNQEVLVGTHDSAAEAAEQAAREAEAQAAAQKAQEEARAAQAQTSGAPTSYSRVVTMNATAYCPCSQCNGAWAGVTATGMKPGYGVAAVDPSFIKLGTRLYVEGYGYCVAGDTGGAIKGNRIDLCYGSHSEALSSGFGHTNVNVYILD